MSHVPTCAHIVGLDCVLGRIEFFDSAYAMGSYFTGSTIIKAGVHLSHRSLIQRFTRLLTLVVDQGFDLGISFSIFRRF